jgi:hypothetical protein
MNCDKTRDLLGWFHDGELDAGQSSLVAQHIEDCPACAAELASLAQLDQASRLLTSPEPPPELWTRIAQRLATRGPGRSAHPRALPRRRFLWAAGVLAASVLGGGLLANRLFRRRAPRAIPDGQVISNPPARTDVMLANFAALSPQDRRLAERQELCASGPCNDRLGAEGKPVKVVLQDKPVFLCSHECEQWARAHPAETLAKLRLLEQRHPKEP